MLRTHYSSQITKAMDGKAVVIAGWVEKVRDLGKVKFLVVRDRDGVTQVTAKTGSSDKKVIDSIDKLTRESVVSVRGKVQKNASAPGEVEILPDEIVVLSKAETPLPLETDP